VELQQIFAKLFWGSKKVISQHRLPDGHAYGRVVAAEKQVRISVEHVISQ
jgi:hypothetical protein